MAYFTAQDYLPDLNMKNKGRAAIERVKKWDVQHDQNPPDLQKPLYTPLCCASVLFFIWGFAYGLLDTMNNHVRKLMELSRAMSALLAVAYYAAYPIAVFAIASPLVKRCGYRFTFVTGLLIFAIGNFIMAAVAGKLIGMVAASFIVGLGVATLERSANPYVVRCGPDRLRAIRINFAQSWAGVGTVISPLAAAGSIVGDKTQKLAAIIHVYLTIGCVIIGISGVFGWVFFRTQCVPEVSADGDEESYGLRKSPLWGCRKLWWGALGNFCNMGCQVAVAQYLMAYLEDNAGLNDIQGAHYLSVAQTAFVIGRLAFCGAVMVVKPRKALALFIFGCIACSTGAIFSKNGAAVAMVVLIMFFEAPLFPTIFETATDGLEKLASRAEDIMISSICGGALLSPLFGLLADSVGAQESQPLDNPVLTATARTEHVISLTGTGIAYSIVVASFCFVALYVLIINIYKPYKKGLDASRSQEKQTGKDAERRTSFTAVPPIVLTTFKSSTVENLASSEETRQRVQELREELRGGPRSRTRPSSPSGPRLEHPAGAALRPSRTCPN